MFFKVTSTIIGLTSLVITPICQAVLPDPAFGNYAFDSSDVQITKNLFGVPVTFTCDIALYISISEASNGDAIIEVVDGIVYDGASSVCTDIEPLFDNGSWYVSDSASPPGSPGAVPSSIFPSTSDWMSPDISLYLHNVDIELPMPLGNCTGSGAITYNNNETYSGPDAPTTIAFSGTFGSCTITGTFFASPYDIDLYQ